MRTNSPGANKWPTLNRSNFFWKSGTAVDASNRSKKEPSAPAFMSIAVPTSTQPFTSVVGAVFAVELLMITLEALASKLSVREALVSRSRKIVALARSPKAEIPKSIVGMTCASSTPFDASEGLTDNFNAVQLAKQNREEGVRKWLS